MLAIVHPVSGSVQVPYIWTMTEWYKILKQNLLKLTFPVSNVSNERIFSPRDSSSKFSLPTFQQCIR